jgi:hypothetical protein
LVTALPASQRLIQTQTATLLHWLGPPRTDLAASFRGDKVSAGGTEEQIHYSMISDAPYHGQQNPNVAASNRFSEETNDHLTIVSNVTPALSSQAGHPGHRDQVPSL